MSTYIDKERENQREAKPIAQYHTGSKCDNWNLTSKSNFIDLVLVLPFMVYTLLQHAFKLLSRGICWLPGTCSSY